MQSKNHVDRFDDFVHNIDLYSQTFKFSLKILTYCAETTLLNFGL